MSSNYSCVEKCAISRGTVCRLVHISINHSTVIISPVDKDFEDALESISSDCRTACCGTYEYKFILLHFHQRCYYYRM